MKVFSIQESMIKSPTKVVVSSSMFINNIFLLVCIFEFLTSYIMFSEKIITILSLVASINVILYFLFSKQNHGLSFALILYTIATQFGMSTIYFLMGSEYLQSFSRTTLSFLNSSLYVKALLLGIISVTAFCFGSQLTKYKVTLLKLNKKNEAYFVGQERKATFYMGSLILIGVFLYLFLYLLSGRIYIGMTYNSYLNSGINNGFYSWLLLLYSIGISFVVAVANKKELQIGLLLFALSAIIFLSTGNRGEVLYPTLSMLGILYYRHGKLKFKYILFAAFIIFVVVPFIRSSRHDGVMSSFNSMGLDFVDSFAEMGHQLRLTVLILEDFYYGSREMLMGFSYYNPLVNILDKFIPFDIRLSTPASFNFEEQFAGLGFSQVAESYANFGLLGVLGFYMILGFFISSAEKRNLEGTSLAFFGALVAMLINATRNRFAFIPASVLFLIIIIFIIKFLARKKIVIK